MNTVTHSYKVKIIIKDCSCPWLHSKFQLIVSFTAIMISFVAAAACCFQRQSLSEHRLYIKDGKAALMSPIDWLGLNVKLHLAALKPDITSNGGLETSQWRLGTHQQFGN